MAFPFVVRSTSFPTHNRARPITGTTVEVDEGTFEVGVSSPKSPKGESPYLPCTAPEGNALGASAMTATHSFATGVNVAMASVFPPPDSIGQICLKKGQTPGQASTLDT